MVVWCTGVFNRGNTMATFNKFNDFAEQIGLEIHNLNTDTLKIYLTNTAPVATNTVFDTPAEISAGNGYTAGGEDVTNVWTESPAGTGSMSCTDVTWTASGGTIGAFRYVVLYNDTAAADNLIGWWDYGSSITLADGETFTADFAATTLTIS